MVKIIGGFFIIIFVSFYLAAQGKEYTIGVENIDWYPYYNFMEGEQSKSHVKELLDTFAVSKGYVFKYKPLPVTRLLYDFLQGEVDFKYPDHPYWSPEIRAGKTITYSEPIAIFTGGAMVLPKNKGRGISKFKTLGIIRGFTPWQWMDSIKQYDITVSQNVTAEGLLLQVLAGRIDGADMEPSVANHILIEMKKPGALVFDETLPTVQGGFLLSTIKYSAIIDELNAFIAANPKLMNQLKTKYGILNPLKAKVVVKGRGGN